MWPGTFMPRKTALGCLPLSSLFFSISLLWLVYFGFCSISEWRLNVLSAHLPNTGTCGLAGGYGHSEYISEAISHIKTMCTGSLSIFISIPFCFSPRRQGVFFCDGVDLAEINLHERPSRLDEHWELIQIWRVCKWMLEIFQMHTDFLAAFPFGLTGGSWRMTSFAGFLHFFFHIWHSDRK